MTKKEKRLKRLRQNPYNVSFQELREVLEDFGFAARTRGGSHWFFRVELKGKVWKLTVPFKKPHVKAAYVKKALKIIDEVMEVENQEDNHADE